MSAETTAGASINERYCRLSVIDICNFVGILSIKRLRTYNRSMLQKMEQLQKVLEDAYADGIPVVEVNRLMKHPTKGGAR